MTTYKFEYIRLDGYSPEPNLRSKTNLITMESFNGDVNMLPERGFDGSSTLQAAGHSSDCVLKPVRVYPDATRKNGRLVMCEVYNSEGRPDETNSRYTIFNTVDSLSDDTGDFRFGFEQEYVFTVGGRPLGFPVDGYPAPQGKYYCGVGSETMGMAREMVERHLDICLDAGLNITCINAEVLKGQWEFGLLSKGAEKAGDDLWLARYLMMRLGEEYGVTMELHPKPVRGDRNGTGMHCNFSNRRMREEGGEEYFTKICETFKKYQKEHIAVYGSDNHLRLTGAHETQSIDQFSYGVSDRGASIRIPLGTVLNGWKGRLEDRRVAANADPYKVVARILKTMSEIE